MRLILASESPRRRELLSMMELDFEVITSHVEEHMPIDASPEETVSSLSLQKAQAVADLYPHDCVIGADTIVFIDGMILGKPRTSEHAKRYLSRMQGRTHTVFTGVTVIADGHIDTRCATTDVTFCPMTEREIEWYVSTGDPLDKAGAYGAQGPFGAFIERIDGTYFNVIGMPLPLLYTMLRDAGMLPKERL